MADHASGNTELETEDKVSVPGFEEHEVAHLSNGQRRKLAEERSAGKKAHTVFAKALAHNEQQVREVQARQEAENGGRPLLSPEAITAQRIAEQRMAEERAREQQAINAAANAAKEAADHNETLYGREVAIATIAPTGDGGNEQAEAGGGAVQSTRTPQFDSQGEYMGMLVDGVFEPDPNYEGDEQPVIPEDVALNRTDPNVGVRETEHQHPAANPPPSFQAYAVHQEAPDNVQPYQTNEPDAATIAAGLAADDDTSSKKGRGKKSGKPASTNAGPIGSGPVSE